MGLLKKNTKQKYDKLKTTLHLDRNRKSTREYLEKWSKTSSRSSGK